MSCLSNVVVVVIFLGSLGGTDAMIRRAYWSVNQECEPLKTL